MAKFTSVDEYIAELPEPMREVAREMKPVIDAALPDAGAALWHGHPTWSLGDAPGTVPVCLLKGYPAYLTFALWRGQAIVDPSGRLEPGARGMAHVKLRAVADIDRPLFTAWLRAARALEPAPIRQDPSR